MLKLLLNLTLTLINNILVIKYGRKLFFRFLLYINSNNICPEKSLWKAVILQVFIDLKNNSKKKIANTYRVKAILWFNMNNNDFIATCHYTGLDPQYVWKKANLIKNRSFEVRKLA